jgi:diadenosine tetraphosphate (Ap4A) HIT family hydrolase
LSPCPFCPPYAFEPTATSALSVALADRFPVTEGHTLIIPRRHVASFFELAPAEQADLLALAAAERGRLCADGGPDAFNLGINDGPAAGQTVPHVHLHLIPRYAGDVADPRGGVRWIVPERAAYWNKG